jgi:uncharacterized membrane protein
MLLGIKEVRKTIPKYNSGHSPQDVAKQCYAKGDIFREEFEQLKEDLS